MANPFEPNSQWQRAFFSRNHLPPQVTIQVFIFCNFSHQSTTNLRHEILAFTIPTLLGFLQIQSVGDEPSPFQQYPATTRASIVCVTAYYFSFRARLWLPSYASQLNAAMTLFGSFSVASLVSLLLPHSWWHMRYLIYFLLMEGEIHQLLMKVYYMYVRRRMLQPWLRPRWRMSSARRLLPQTNMDLMD